MKITAKNSIGEVLNLYKGAAKVFAQFGLSCLTCGGAQSETIEIGARTHGVDPEAVVKELNKLAQQQK